MQSNFHVVAFSGSVGAGLSNVQIAAVNDTILTITNNSFLVPARARIGWAYGFGTGLDRLRLNTPSLRYVALPSLVPINTSVTVPSPYNLVDLTDRPTFVDPIDQVQIDASSVDAGAQTMRCIMAFSWGRKEPPAGVVYRARATATVTCVAETWVNGSLTFDQSLPQGRYEVVGMDAWGTNLISARLVFPGASFRPGVIARNTAAGVQHDFFAKSEMGSFGFFDQPNNPTIDFLSSGACTAQTVFLDLIRVSNAPGYSTNPNSPPMINY